jgi:ABC-type polysaccharide/polyol phosphate transport system ATPase subunit
MDDFAVQIQNLSKIYRVYNKPSDMIMEMITGKARHSEFWALKDVSFGVRRGQVMGIIGRNGAGKTTLLRIIAETLDKTSGDVLVNGKVSAIMALGTGFNLELDGRENILLGGMCLGMTRVEILGKMDSIVDFSGLRDFISQPVKTYSSGMISRLAFSTAVSVDPDILIIDEALSTGDMAFTAKSFARIREIATSGATVLFVTHALQTIYDLCHSAILLEGGRILAMGEPRHVGHVYEQQIFREMAALNQEAVPVVSVVEKSDQGLEGKPIALPTSDSRANNRPDFPESSVASTSAESQSHSQSVRKESESENLRGAEIIETVLLDSQGRSGFHLHQEERYTIRVSAICYRDFESISIGFRIQTPAGTAIYGTSNAPQGIRISARAGETVSVDFDFVCLLAAGSYFIAGGAAEPLGELSEHYHYNMIHFVADAVSIEVFGKNNFAGCVDMKSVVLDIRHRNIDFGKGVSSSPCHA